MYLNIKNADTPATLPKISPLKKPYPEVLDSINIINRKKQFIRPKGLILETTKSPAKKIKKPKM